MQPYLVTKTSKPVVPLTIVREKGFKAWRSKQCDMVHHWLDANEVTGKAGQVALLPQPKTGELREAVAVVKNEPDIWSLAHLPKALPKQVYNPQVAGQEFSLATWGALALGWQLATYQFTQCKGDPKPKDGFATLLLPEDLRAKGILDQADAVRLVRDLINRPANDLTPLALADAAREVAKTHKADCSVIEGDALLKENYPLVHAVGRASANTPCLIDLRWGSKDAPKLTLVGKGVVFDSGGLDIKPAAGMKLMKKDMGGAAHVLGLAQLIMSAKLNVRLRVLIPAVENSISNNAFRPQDVIKSRKGITVEIGNTDAEGRLVLCDALAEAMEEKPDLLIDCATLTGAARVALGTDVPAFFTPDDKLAGLLDKASAAAHDPLWRLPLWQGYRDLLNSDVADINNAGSSGFGGAITAALYLQEFIGDMKRWIHIDMMAWNNASRPGRPAGGEAMGLRALYQLIESRYS